MVRYVARPIELGLILEGDDALAFHWYIKNPTDTPKGSNSFRKHMKSRGNFLSVV
jgi:hypothetical protein